MLLEEGAERVLRVRAKAVLRKRMRAVRGSLPEPAALSRSQAIAAAVAATDEVQAAQTVALFCAIAGRKEVDLRGLDEVLRARGVRVAYPWLPPREGVTPGAFPALGFRFATVESLAERGWGFAEPPGDAEEATSLDVVVVPALCIDPRGHRLGYGGGFYDRTLRRFPDAFSIGVAFHFQLIGEIPDTVEDVPVKLVVTDERQFRVA